MEFTAETLALKVNVCYDICYYRQVKLLDGKIYDIFLKKKGQVLYREVHSDSVSARNVRTLFINGNSVFHR